MRRRTMRSGVALGLRELAGMTIRLAGVVLLIRLIGPGDYGLYAGSVAFVFVATTVAQMSSELFLVRQPDLTERLCSEVASFLVVASLAVTSVFLVGCLIAARMFSLPTSVPLVLLLSVPISVLWAPAQAQLERSFRFGGLAALELGGDVVLYAIALPLAAAGLGAMGPAIGFVCWQVYLLVGSYALVPTRPTWSWSPSTNRAIVGYGSGITAAQGTRRASELVNPVIVGPLLGASAVGIVALALRLIETLSVVLRLSGRLVFAGLSRLQNDRHRFGAVLSEAMALRTLAVGVTVGSFTFVAADVVPLVFGDEWAPTVDVLPWLASAALLLAVAGALTEALSVLGRTGVVACAEALRFIVGLAAAFVLVPSFGERGFGMAIAIATIPMVLAHFALRSHTSISYRPAIMWLGVLAPLVFAPYVDWQWRWLLVLPFVVYLATPVAHGQLGAALQSVRGDRSLRASGASAPGRRRPLTPRTTEGQP